MDPVRIRLLGAKVTGFSPARQEISLSIRFSDGKEKEVYRDIAMGNSWEAAGGIMADIRKMEARVKECVGRPGLVSVCFEDEEPTLEKMRIFLSKVFEKSKIIKNYRSSEGYMNLLKDITRMQADF